MMYSNVSRSVLDELNNIQEEILKIGWRGVAKKYHPDMIPGHPETEEVFKCYRMIYENMKDRLFVKL